CAVARALFWCVDIGVDFIAAGTDLFGRNGRLRLVEIRRTLLEESRQRFLGFRGAYALTECLVFHTDGCFDLVDETLLEEPLGGQQCAAGFCSELLRGCGGGCEQVPVRHHAGHEAQLRRPRGSERPPPRRSPIRKGTEYLEPNSAPSARLMTGSWTLALPPA